MSVSADDAPPARPVRLVHPVADEIGDEHVLFATGARTVRYTAPFALFLVEATESGLRPVLMTRIDASVSALVSLAMRRAGGVWAAQARDMTTFDALTGYRIGRLEELWGPVDSARARLPGFTDHAESAVRVLTFTFHARRRATDSTIIGPLAQDLTVGLGGEPLDRWGAHEPVADPWDTAAVTRRAREGMPGPAEILAKNPSGGFVRTRVERTRTGLLEQVEGGIPVAPGVATTALLDRAAQAAESVMEKHFPTLGFVSLAHYDPADDGGGVPGDAAVAEGDERDHGLVQRARGRLPEAPLAVVVGARAVRDLGLDTGELARSHDVRVVGRRKTPGLVIRFSGPDGLWNQLAAFAAVIGPERIARTVGLTPAPGAGS